MRNEADIQNEVRLAASAAGWRVFRNNVGTLLTERGVPVRFGLANDSVSVNKYVKSGDLIGIRPVLITADMVGKTIGQFVSLEVKRQGWIPNQNNDHENAQRRWADIVTGLGGYAIFTTGQL